VKFFATHIPPGIRVVLTVNHPNSHSGNAVMLEVFRGGDKLAEVEVSAESLDRTDRGLQDVLKLLPGFQGPVKLVEDKE
jgi:hypothetical protein